MMGIGFGDGWKEPQKPALTVAVENILRERDNAVEENNRLRQKILEARRRLERLAHYVNPSILEIREIAELLR